MAFTKDIVERAWALSKGQCQCERSFHDHDGRCPNELVWEDRGNHDKPTGWQDHSKSSAYRGLSDCEILCLKCFDSIW
ncbi:MAG TPA: hypothetical protein G4O15_01005 [Dehalococcoidia bacterium]|nr:hypothetical protein [Dehalococcoidia bacterium]